MQLLFKQRVFSWFDSYDIYDEKGNTVYVVKGELAWGHRLQIYDSVGNHLGTVKERVLTFLPKFQLFIGDRKIGELVKEFTFLRPKFSLDCRGWEIEGDIFAWNYQVTDQRGTTVMNAQKRLLSFSDTYVIDVLRREDALYALMVVLAIDAAKCSSNNS